MTNNKEKAEVLIVEDDVSAAEDLDRRLKGQGYFVRCIATSGKMALDRIDRLLQEAAGFLLEIPSEKRVLIHIPKRFPTTDPAEQWTHGKVCRRQAEHVWEHLRGMHRRAEAARKADV